jgi:hypothetical protein
MEIEREGQKEIDKIQDKVKRAFISLCHDRVMVAPRQSRKISGQSCLQAFESEPRKIRREQPGQTVERMSQGVGKLR